MVYDCFAFFNELDLLEIRLNTLNDVVDKFVLVEATRTFQKKPKPLYFEENKQRFSPFLHKIEHIAVDKFPNFFYKFRIPKAWDYDNYQKDQVAIALKNCKPDDVIIYSDLDEIPNGTKIKAFQDHEGIKVFQMRHYYYYLNGLEVEKSNHTAPAWWNGTVMCKYKDFVSVQKLRVQRETNKYKTGILIEDAGWHFAYLGGVEKIIQKIDSYAHTEHNLNNFKNPDHIKEIIKSGKGLYDNDIQIVYQSLDHTYPKFIIDNQAQLQHLIYKDFN